MITMGNPVQVPVEVVRRNVDLLGIKYNDLPRRPFWAFFNGLTEQEFKLQIATKVMASSALTGRQLTQPEKDALSQHYAKFLVTQVWDTPFVFASTYAMYRRTYAQYGFPFWIPKADKFNPNRFPLISSLHDGPSVPRVWHGLRFFAWYAGCKIIIGIFFASYSLSVFVANYFADPRLIGFHEANKAWQKRHRQSNALQPDQKSRPGVYDGQEPSSPWDSTEQSTQDSQSTWPGMQSSQPERAQAPLRDDDRYSFDDASPVAPTEEQTTASQRTTQGSAWDRIRSQVRSSGAAQGQGSAGQTNAWQRKRDDERTSRGAQEGTSFSFSSGDEEKAYAKEQAQKDFDEMLEKERRGETSGRR